MTRKKKLPPRSTAIKYRVNEFAFWGNVAKSDGCWVWLGKPAGRVGGGMVSVRVAFGWERRFVHRVAWELEHGQGKLDKLHVLHRCNEPLCVKLDHLFLGDRSDKNAKRFGRRWLTDKQVRRIRRLYDRNMKPATIARLFPECSYGLIWNCATRRSYRQVSE